MVYNGKFVILNDQLMYNDENITEKEEGWLYNLNVSLAPSSSNVPAKWKSTNR